MLKRLHEEVERLMRAFAAFSLWLTVLGLAGSTCLLRAQKNVAEQYLLTSANEERAARGLAALVWDDSLADAASTHAHAMAQNRDISHRFAGEAELSDRGALAGAKFTLISENVAEAPLAMQIHVAWMKSPGHRENLLDPKVNSIGIAVVVRDHQLYAVEDFAHITPALSLEQQEETTRRLLARLGLRLLSDTSDARPTCSSGTGFQGSRTPNFIMRYTTTTLETLPEALTERIDSRRYRQGAVGACEDRDSDGFSGYRLAVLLYF